LATSTPTASSTQTCISAATHTPEPLVESLSRLVCMGSNPALSALYVMRRVNRQLRDLVALYMTPHLLHFPIHGCLSTLTSVPPQLQWKWMCDHPGVDVPSVEFCGLVLIVKGSE
jgi:hypothetical protein